MQQQNRETRERILEAGRQEFLQNGFKGASLRKIAARAGVTTGAIYGYFPDKEALFCALVEEPAERLMNYFLDTQRQFDALPAAQKVADMNARTRESVARFLDKIYDDIDAFKLITCCAEGTRYAAYLDRLVEIEEEYTLRFMDAAREAGHDMPGISMQVVHILCSSNYKGMFEVVAHDMPRGEAIGHIMALTEFFRAGWMHIMQLPDAPAPGHGDN